jgi:hypothetical protein
MWPYAKLTINGGSLAEEQIKTCDESLRQSPIAFGHTIFPSEQFPQNMGVGEYSVGTNLSKEDVARGLSPDNQHLMLLFIVGCIDYTFPTDPKGHHQTPFILRIHKKGPDFRGIGIDDKLIPPGDLVLLENGIGIGSSAD